MTIPRTDYSQIAEHYDKLRPPIADVWLSKIIEYGKINEDSRVLARANQIFTAFMFSEHSRIHQTCKKS